MLAQLLLKELGIEDIDAVWVNGYCLQAEKVPASLAKISLKTLSESEKDRAITRAINALGDNANIKTFGDLYGIGPQKLAVVPGFGGKGYQALNRVLKAKGYPRILEVCFK